MVKLGIFALIAFFLYSAVTLVTIRYDQRKMFIKAERLTKTAKQLQTKWLFLELDRANLTSTINLDRQMTGQLKMRSPSVGDIIYIKESELAPVQDDY